jgi:hypothetical protein
MSSNMPSLEAAKALWQTTADGLFGPLLPMLDRLDAPSVALLLNDRGKLIAYAALEHRTV